MSALGASFSCTKLKTVWRSCRGNGSIQFSKEIITFSECNYSLRRYICYQISQGLIRDYDNIIDNPEIVPKVCHRSKSTVKGEKKQELITKIIDNKVLTEKRQSYESMQNDLTEDLTLEGKEQSK